MLDQQLIANVAFGSSLIRKVERVVAILTGLWPSADHLSTILVYRKRLDKEASRFEQLQYTI
jgi:hypothetical protein